jgi:hypothetical protein
MPAHTTFVGGRRAPIWRLVAVATAQTRPRTNGFRPLGMLVYSLRRLRDAAAKQPRSRVWAIDSDDP